MNFEELITEFRKRKYIFIVVPVLIFVFAFGLQYRVLQTFQSSTTFIVNETDIYDYRNSKEDAKGNLVNDNVVNVNRIFLFAHSSEMMNHLIKKYRLFQYYQVDSTAPFAYARLVNRLSGNIHLMKKDFNIIEITVSDRDRVLPATMANEIVTKLNSINESYVKLQLKRKIVVNQGMHGYLKNELKQEDEKLAVLIENFKTAVKVYEKNKVEVTNLQFSLKDLSQNIINKENELIQIQQLNYVLLQTLEKEHLDTITVINMALPDYRSTFTPILLISFFVSILSFGLMIVLLNGYLIYKKEIYFLFGIK